MLGLTPEEIYKYSTYIFIFWTATFLVRKMWSLLEGKITNTDNNVTENKRLNLDMAKSLKDVSVIQAQILTKQDSHDKSNIDAWGKMLTGFDRICEFLNGKNPAIAKIRSELEESREKIK